MLQMPIIIETFLIATKYMVRKYCVRKFWQSLTHAFNIFIYMRTSMITPDRIS